jgi:hypothetical protein
MQRDSLQPKLDAAQQALKVALDEACNVDLRRADTGEMIRIEETLAIAANAAKEAVSVRLRRRRRQEADSVAGPDVGERQVDRVFDDFQGKRWHTYAVHPSGGGAESVPLPDAFRHGWLCFESHDQLRRLAPIPEAWDSMPLDDLRALCSQAEAAHKRL